MLMLALHGGGENSVSEVFAIGFGLDWCLLWTLACPISHLLNFWVLESALSSLGFI